MSKFLNELEKTNQLPKTILYSLNPKDYYALGTWIGCYQGDNVRNKVLSYADSEDADIEIYNIEEYYEE